MNKKQWFILGIAFVLTGIFFIFEDMLDKCNNYLGEELTSSDVHCLLNTELRDPFIPLFFIFGVIVFPILGWLEKGDKK